MRKIKIIFWVSILVLMPLCSSCNLFNGDPSLADGESGGFGAIIFCENVTEDGVVIGASNNFPEDINVVWAYFNYWGLEKGEPWGRLWTHDGQEFINAQNEIWEDSKEGWVAYSIGGDYDLEPGKYELTLLLNNDAIQRASFQIINK